jgi:hypothetical protein
MARGKKTAPPLPAPAVQNNTPPTVSTQTPDAPVKQIDGPTLRQLGGDLQKRFTRFASDRLPTEQKYIRNLRQYLGIYDPEILEMMSENQSRAYPRLTRVKCISMLSRVMNLMFPGNEDNWELTASPSAEINPLDAKQAVQDLQKTYTDAKQAVPPIDDEFVTAAVQRLADKRAQDLALLIKDQMAEIGGDQTLDYISLVRQVVFSGIRYGLGVLEGPYLKEEMKTVWSPAQGGFVPKQSKRYKPMYEFLPVWDYYPDFTAKSLGQGDGYFIRKVMTRGMVRKLADRPGYFSDQIKTYLRNNTQGNYKAKDFETQLRTMGTRKNTNDQKADPHGRYEVIIWRGLVSAATLMQLGAEVPEKYKADDVDAEVWIIEDTVIKADINTWRKLGCDVKTVHTFVFDEDDTSPIGNGLPNVMRDSQMSLCAATRMAIDNGSVVCGPMLELNVSLLTAGQEAKPIAAYQTFERDDNGPSAQFPAVREIKVDSHIAELVQLIEMFTRFMDAETFIGPATGGDMDKMPSEPMRTAAGASMMKGDAALPFKDIIRNFDFFTQSVILSLVYFNRLFNPQVVKEGDYDVVARGATSLIAKEVRGIQIDFLAQALSPDDRDWVDEEKFMQQRFGSRDMQGMLVSSEEAMRRRAVRQAAAAAAAQTQSNLVDAQARNQLSQAYKNIAQGKKNTAGADKTDIESGLAILESILGPQESQATNSAPH